MRDAMMRYGVTNDRHESWIIDGRRPAEQVVSVWLLLSGFRGITYCASKAWRTRHRSVLFLIVTSSSQNNKHLMKSMIGHREVDWILHVMTITLLERVCKSARSDLSSVTNPNKLCSSIWVGIYFPFELWQFCSIMRMLSRSVNFYVFVCRWWVFHATPQAH